MTPSAPPVGLKHSKTLTVDAGLTVPQVSPAFADFRAMPPVFATAYLVGFVEATCVEALKPYLTDGRMTVGTHIDISHSAATPIGMRVTATVELIAVEGRRLRFRVECRDDAEAIAAGHHDRVLIDPPKFIARVEAKGRTAG